MRVDRGWISVYTRDGTQLLDRVVRSPRQRSHLAPAMRHMYEQSTSCSACSDRIGLQIPFADSPATASDAETDADLAAVDDARFGGSAAEPWEHGHSGEAIFPSRSDAGLDDSEYSSSSSSSSGSESEGDGSQHAPQARSEQEQGRSSAGGGGRGLGPVLFPVVEQQQTAGRSARSAGTAGGAGDRATPAVGVHWHDPRSPWQVGQDLRAVPWSVGARRERTYGSDRAADDGEFLHSRRASPPPMGHYESSAQAQRPQTAASSTRAQRSRPASAAAAVAAPEFTQAEPEPEPEPAPDLTAWAAAASGPGGGAAGPPAAAAADFQEPEGGDLQVMPDDMLQSLQRELAQKLDEVTGEIKRRHQAALENQVGASI